MIYENERTKLKQIASIIQELLYVKDQAIEPRQRDNGLIYAAKKEAIFYTDISKQPVHRFSEQWKANIGNWTNIKMDFGSGTWDGVEIGIPITIADKNMVGSVVKFDYSDESDVGNYYIGKIEGGSDKHSIVVTPDMKLHEIFNWQGEGKAGSGAKWDLTISLKMRPNGWTSADAAGLPIAPFLIRHDEIESGVINHALRMTVSKTRGSTFPASHHTSGLLSVVESVQTPLGAYFRLPSEFDISKLSSVGKIIATAMKTYGIVIADNGADGFISGCPNERWNNDMLAEIGNDIKIKDLDAIDVSKLIVSADSYEAKQS